MASAAPADTEVESRRPYHSPRRVLQAAQTRADVLRAATELFSERGWAATGVRDIARVAGVSVKTVHANFRTKGELLTAAIDVAVVGDDEPVPLDERPEFVALGRGTREDRTRAAARLVTDVHRRTAGVRFALREAAASDPDLDRWMREREEGRRNDVAEGLALVGGGPVPSEQVDALWAVLDIGVYWLLTDLRGWTDQQYESWMADTIDRLLDGRDG